MSRTPEDWLEDGFELAWPEYIPRKDYRRAIEMVVTLGGALKGIKRPPSLAEGALEAAPKDDRPLPERIKEMLLAENLTVAQMAERTGHAAGSVRPAMDRIRPRPRVVDKAVVGNNRKANVYGLRKVLVAPKKAVPVGRGTPVQRVREVLQAGPVSTTDVARKAGVHRSYVGVIAKRLGAKVVDTVGTYREKVWHLNGVDEGAPEVRA